MLILNIFKFSLLLQLKHNIKQSSYQIIGDNKKAIKGTAPF
jgi:hypothetical protein